MYLLVIGFFDLLYVLCGDGYFMCFYVGQVCMGVSYDCFDDFVLCVDSYVENLVCLQYMLLQIVVYMLLLQVDVDFFGWVGQCCIVLDCLLLVGVLLGEVGIYGLLGYVLCGLIWVLLMVELLVVMIECEFLLLLCELVVVLDLVCFGVDLVIGFNVFSDLE